MQLIKTKTQMIGPFMQKNEFYADLTKMTIATDIPFYKLKSEAFKSFFEKYVHKTRPDESTVRNNYLKDCYYSVLQKIRLEIGKNPIFVSIDETTDKAGRSVTSVIFGSLHENGRGYFLTVEVLAKVNSSTIATVDALISNLKKVFLKSPTRMAVFKEIEPTSSLPPRPVITRWGTWLIAAVYYADNFESIKRIVDHITDDAACVSFSKQLLNKYSILPNLIYIKHSFGFILEEKVFEVLQKTGAPVGEVLNILDNTQKRATEVRGHASNYKQ